MELFDEEEAGEVVTQSDDHCACRSLNWWRTVGEVC
jgi:hypothetical protein